LANALEFLSRSATSFCFGLADISPAALLFSSPLCHLPPRLRLHTIGEKILLTCYSPSSQHRTPAAIPTVRRRASPKTPTDLIVALPHLRHPNHTHRPPSYAYPQLHCRRPDLIFPNASSIRLFMSRSCYSKLAYHTIDTPTSLSSTWYIAVPVALLPP
jgi:hypothetical protein